MREVSYYPGCSLESSAADYAASIAGVASLLEIKLVEIKDWNCCGATAAHSLDHAAALNLGARNLALAVHAPHPLVVPCALCFNRLKSAQAELGQSRAGLTPEVASLGDKQASVRVVELNGFLTSAAMRQTIEDKATRSLTGLRVVCYYGCQGQRPPRVTGHPQHENPTGMDLLLTALGADVPDWPGKTDCCGASHSVPRPDIVATLTSRLFRWAAERGADAIVTGCQMCQANLDLYQDQAAQALGRPLAMPIFYLTELAGLALGHAQAPRWLARHMVDPRPLLAERGLLG